MTSYERQSNATKIEPYILKLLVINISFNFAPLISFNLVVGKKERGGFALTKPTCDGI